MPDAPIPSPCRLLRTVGLITLIACGGSAGRDDAPDTGPEGKSNESGATREIDACALLTLEDVLAVTGERMKRQEEQRLTPGVPGASQDCAYRSVGKNRIGKSGVIRFYAQPGRYSKEERTRLLETMQGMGGNPGDDPVPVSGIGDQASWAQINPTMGQLHVFDEAYFQIQMWGVAEGDRSREIASALARKVLERL